MLVLPYVVEPFVTEENEVALLAVNNFVFVTAVKSVVGEVKVGINGVSVLAVPGSTAVRVIL